MESKSLEDTQKRLSELYMMRDQLIAFMNMKGMVDQQTQGRVKAIDDEIRILQDFCNVKLLESIKQLLRSLDSESRKLKSLTLVLILLTVVLTVLAALSVYKAFT